MSRRRLAGTGAALLALGFAAQAAAQSDPHFSADQALRGRAAYEANCAACHGFNLDDGQFAPPLKGAAFQQRWAGKSVADLLAHTMTMPPGRADSLPRDTFVQLVALMLQANGVQPGSQDLPSDPRALQAMRVTTQPLTEEQLQRARMAAGPSGGLTVGVTLPPWPTPPNPLDRFTPVTDAMLANPPPGDWLTWRRTQDAMGFSPLDQINKSNVRNLGLAWSYALPPGPNTATPLVHDGVIFVHGYGDSVHALDATNGDLLWRYARQLPQGVNPTVKRNMALYGDKLFVGTSDLHVVALDVKSGKVVWEKAIARIEDRWSLSGGPVVARGKVMQGIVGRGPGGAYIAALDAETGEEAWRFYSIARPDEPGGNSWNGLPLEARNGGSVWTTGYYDPELDLVFFGPAPTYDTGPLRNRVNKPGITNDALYTNATIALNPETGKLVWYYQHVPNDQWDFDWVFERQILRLPVDGRERKVVLTSGKQAIYDALDAATGRYLFSIDLGLQNIITHIDPRTGAKRIDPDLVPGDGKPKMVCPHAGGAKNWIPASYNPGTKMLYVPLEEHCMDLTPVPAGERGSLSTGVRWSVRPRPDSDGRYGRIQAINLETRQTVWVQRQRAPQTSGVLATAGGVVFAGAQDRWLKAYDDATGQELWKTRLSDVHNSAPISYMVNGRQYVAVMVGYGGAIPASYAMLIPEIPPPSARSGAIHVFALPEQ